MEALRNLRILGIELQREVRGEHDRRVPLRAVVSVRHQACRLPVGGNPLELAGGTLGELPLVAEQVVQELRCPAHRVGGPGAFQAARERVAAGAGTGLVLPAQALFFDRRGCRFGSHVLLLDGAVGLPESVSASDEGHGLLVVHRHAAERLPDVPGRRDRIRLAVRPLRIHVDQPHLNRAERLRQVPVAAVALVAEPLGLGPPVGLVGLPFVHASAGEAEGLESHRFEGDVPRQDHQIGPRELPAVFRLDRPEQAPRLVQVRVVRPTVEWLEPLLASPGAAAAVGHAIGARTVPRHPDEQRPVVAVVRRPPVLGGRHDLLDVLLHGSKVEGAEFLGVVVVVAHRIGLGCLLAQRAQIQLIGPPESVRGCRLVRHGIRLSLLGLESSLCATLARTPYRGIGTSIRGRDGNERAGQSSR